MDKEGKTPLIVACLRHDLLPVAKILIELGANVNVYRPGEKLLLVPSSCRVTYNGNKFAMRPILGFKITTKWSIFQV